MKITVIRAAAAAGVVVAMFAAPGVALADGIDEGQTCFGQAVTIVAVPGEQTKGTEGRDVIRGSDGDDDILAGDGDDLICSGLGDDYVQPGAGRDSVRAGEGDDLLWLTDGEVDDVDGGSGNDSAHIDQGIDKSARVEDSAL